MNIFDIFQHANKCYAFLLSLAAYAVQISQVVHIFVCHSLQRKLLQCLISHTVALL